MLMTIDSAKDEGYHQRLHHSAGTTSAYHLPDRLNFFPYADVPKLAFDGHVDHFTFRVHHQRDNRIVSDDIDLFNRCWYPFDHH